MKRNDGMNINKCVSLLAGWLALPWTVHIIKELPGTPKTQSKIHSVYGNIVQSLASDEKNKIKKIKKFQKIPEMPFATAVFNSLAIVYLFNFYFDLFACVVVVVVAACSKML